MHHQQLFLSIFSLVLLATPLAAKWELEKNVYVVESDWHPDAAAEEVELTCDSSEEDVTWTLGQNSKLLGTGKTLTVQVKEFVEAGNYSCWHGEEVVGHSFLLIHKKEEGIGSTDILKDWKEPKIKTFLKCEAKSYSGAFTCSWLTDVRSMDLKFTIKGSKDSSVSQGVTCGQPLLSEEKVLVGVKEYNEYTAECQVSFCMYAEESQPIKVVLDAIEKNKYENYTSKFFIRDIIKPDPPTNLQLKPSTNSHKPVEVTWEYPQSWSTPHSYFSLTFQVQIHTPGKKEKILMADGTSVNVKCHKETKIRVQARDCYYHSSWSKWASVSCNDVSGAVGAICNGPEIKGSVDAFSTHFTLQKCPGYCQGITLKCRVEMGISEGAAYLATALLT
ncbi:interleukin-12 subunit beta [Tachyglossus aculeatus]|uniref:interleukin-12 subunit beta n=1 Tax=Tachyglossus aculeatus TaxID=9261 RepID=UPI0018F2D4DF|nr:interleukin-12 subunit beta [Tachyglossus aculeatus]